MSLNEKSQGHKQEEPISSLAELSRQYLYGNVDVEAYLALERQLTLPLRESITTADQESKANEEPKKQQMDTKSDERK